MLHANHEKYLYLCKKLHSLCQEQKHLHRKSTFQAEDGAFTMKWFSERLNETPAHTSKWLNTIYDDLFELNCQEPELFVAEGEILCEFYISGYRDGMACCFNFGLPALPHVGDTLVFPFGRNGGNVGRSQERKRNQVPEHPSLSKLAFFYISLTSPN